MTKEEITEVLLDKGFVFAPLFGRDAILTLKNFDGCTIYVDTVKRTPIELAQGLKDKFDIYLKDKNGKLISSINGRNLDNVEEIVDEFIGKAETLFPTEESEPTPEPTPEPEPVKPQKKLNTKTLYFDCNCYTTPVEISYYGALKDDTPLNISYSYKYSEDGETYDSSSSSFYADEYDEDSDDSFELVSTPEVGTELLNNEDTIIIFKGLELN